MEITLPLPPEPHALKSLARTLLLEAPAAGLTMVEDGAWLADALWEEWRAPLDRGGMDRERFGRVVAGYHNEVRLWLMGERLWEQCVAGLAGRAARRAIAASAVERSNGHASQPAHAARADHWRTALRRVRVAPDAEFDDLVAAIDDLQLLHEIAPIASSDRLTGPTYAIVWAGSRPRDPEVAYGEGRSDSGPAPALAEALGHFLLKDPAYPPA